MSLVTPHGRRGSAATILALTLAVSAWAPLAAIAALPATIEVRARALQPGEPVRIDVVTDEAPLFLAASFGERVVALSPAGRDADGRARWSGWSMIGLDAEAGPRVIEVTGRAASGVPVVGTRAVTVLEKAFPQEQLSVAPKYVEPPPEVQERLARERAKLKGIYTSRREVAPPREPFVRPVPGKRTSEFGTRRVFNGKPRSPHSGLDLRAATGTPVHASGPGRVVLAEDLYYSGNTVIVDHGGGLFTLYAHLSKIEVAEGDDVEPGALVGSSGATGRVTGPHLHWGAKIGDEPFDPTALLDANLF